MKKHVDDSHAEMRKVYKYYGCSTWFHHLRSFRKHWQKRHSKRREKLVDIEPKLKTEYVPNNEYSKRHQTASPTTTKLDVPTSSNDSIDSAICTATGENHQNDQNFSETRKKELHENFFVENNEIPRNQCAISSEEYLLACSLIKKPNNSILEGLSKDPVCQCCLKSGCVMKCIGKCSEYFHKQCFDRQVTESDYNAVLKQKLKKNSIEIAEPVCSIKENLSNLQCQSCKATQKTLCFVCKI